MYGDIKNKLMKPSDICIGNYLRFKDDEEQQIILNVRGVSGDGTCLVSINGDTALDEVDISDLTGMYITHTILEKNGWEYKNGIYVKKGPVRLGWYEKKKELIIGYHTMPIIVEFVHTLQHIIRLLGLEEEDIVL